MVPTPEEERNILIGLLAVLSLTVFGAMAFMVLFAFVLGKVSQ